MDYLEETKLVTKMKCDGNLAYLLNQDDLFLPTEYKVIQSQSSESFIKCMKLFYNGKIQLFYLTEDYISLKNIFSSINEKNFIEVIINLFTSIMDVKNNGFLSIQNIDISFDCIFIDHTTYKVKLIYLPINKKYNDIQFDFEKNFVNDLVKFIKNSPFNESTKINQIIDKLENITLSFDNLYLQIKENNTKKYTKKIISQSQCKSSLKLISINAPVYMEFNINKDEYILGFKKDAVDGLISYNKKISRIHCKIKTEGNKYTIIDLDSANGTYVNRVRLQAYHPCIIKNGDTIRLANSDFKVIIE